MYIAAQIISAAASIYLILIFFRILISWFSGVEFGKPYRMLASITDPYLNYFRRFDFMRVGAIDLSPLAGMLVLVVVADVFSTFARTGSIGIGIILAIILNSLWGVVGFVLTLFTILVIIRFVAALMNASTVHPFIRTIDMIITPVMNLIHRTFFKNRFLTFRTGLAITGALLIAVNLLGNFLIGRAVLLLESLPV
jgi:YggT family protein